MLDFVFDVSPRPVSPYESVDGVRAKSSNTRVTRHILCDEDLGWFIGLYVAEGCCESSRLTITLHIDETDVADKWVSILSEKFNLSAKVKKNEENHTLKIRVSSRILCNFFSELVPGKAITKTLSYILHNQHDDFKKGLLRGWVEGDGHIDDERDNFSVTGVTSSDQLAKDLYRMSTEVGIKPTWSIRKQADHQNAPSNVLSFCGSPASVLLKKPQIHKRGPKSYQELETGYSVQVESTASLHVRNVMVYNLKVQNTHSYVVSGFAVHNCVGQSHQLIAQGTMAINSILDGTKYPGDPCVADQYAGGRVDVAGQPGRWQGSNGGWSAEWLTNRGGMLLGAELGLPDGVLDEKAWYERNRADEKIAMQWTATRQGVPEQYEKVAKVRPIEGSAMVQTVEEVDAALGNLQFINICTSLIPDAERGQGGVSRMRRRGGHSTVIAGNDGPDEYPYLYVQSWWKAYKGPNPYSDPFMADFNSAVCYISRRDLASVLTSRDCFTFWGVQGLEPVQNSFRI
jgi:hypothetical protein